MCSSNKMWELPTFPFVCAKWLRVCLFSSKWCGVVIRRVEGGMGGALIDMLVAFV